MEPKKFLKSYKCDCFQPENYCNCRSKTASADALIQNIKDTAESLIEVMKLCGISAEKTKDISDVIMCSFLHFEEVVRRIDAVPKKRLNKEDLMHDLGRKCLMDRAEAQMAYSIIKRAFKAFYYGTSVGGVPNNLLKNQLTHTSECLWAHAAQRIAQACASYEGLFHAAQKNLECRIKLIYKDLHDRISTRDRLDDNHECVCPKCVKRINRETLNPVESVTDLHLMHHPFEGVYLKEQAKSLGAQADGEAGAAEKTHCSCPSLKVTEKDCEQENSAENTDSSQSSFEWIPISREEFEEDRIDAYVKSPEELFYSPRQSLEDCSTEYECTCEDCTCPSDHTLQDGEEIETAKDGVSMTSEKSSVSVHGFYDDAIF